MATTVPSRGGSPAPRSTATPPSSVKREQLAAGPRGGALHETLGWLRSVLDRPLTSYHLVLASVSLLLVVGLMMVLSASSVSAYVNFDDSYFYVKRQAVFLAVGVVGALVLMKMPFTTLRALSWFAVGLAAVLLVLTYTPLGIERGGNRNWLYLGSEAFSIQPAEFAKLAMIVWGADVLARKQRLLDQPKHLLVPYLPVCGLLILLVVFQGDAGTAVVMAGIVAGVLWIVAFTRVDRGLSPFAWTLLLVVVAVALLAVTVPEAGMLAPAVVVYGMLLLAMAWLASSHGWVGALGGALFVLSDGLIALGAFRPDLVDWANRDLVVMATYVGAQAMFVAAILLTRSPELTWGRAPRRETRTRLTR